MGIIAEALHIELDEPVALKFLKPEVVKGDLSGTLAGRFVREARSTFKIRSEHVPRIFDVTTLENGVPYIVMELLVGEDLDKRLETHGPLPTAFSVDALLQSLEALAAAHALGMVHRDLKTANLFVSTRLDGSMCVKVLDFGIAKLIDQNGTGGNHALTGTNMVMGSPRYMAPEQMRSTRDVDARADVWAIGTTLYELLTGRCPFDGESLTQVCAAILQDDPETIAQRRPDVPPGLEAVVLRCLAKRAADRYANVAELAFALAAYGTAPTALEIASRVSRVLGAPPSPVSLAKPLSSARPSDAAIAIEATSDTVLSSASGSSFSGIGMTKTSWSDVGASAQTSRRRLWTLLSGFALLFIIGVTLGGIALWRSHSPREDGRALVVATSPTTGIANSVSEVALPPAASAALPTIAVDGAPSAAPSGSPSTPSSLKVKRRLSTSAAPVPLTARTNVESPAAASTAKAPPQTPKEGLWDDRK